MFEHEKWERSNSDIPHQNILEIRAIHYRFLDKHTDPMNVCDGLKNYNEFLRSYINYSHSDTLPWRNLLELEKTTKNNDLFPTFIKAARSVIKYQGHEEVLSSLAWLCNQSIDGSSMICNYCRKSKNLDCMRDDWNICVACHKEKIEEAQFS